MSKSIFLFFYLILLSTMFSCGYDEFIVEDRIIAVVTDEKECVFVQNDETLDGLVDKQESMIMKSCFENRFTSLEEIESNLLGNWNLSGYGSFWCIEVSQPCASLTIDKDSLVFNYNDGFIDTTYHLAWYFEQFGNNGNDWRLRTSLGFYRPLYFQVFCEKYMYHYDIPSDDNMYIYSKEI